MSFPWCVVLTADLPGKTRAALLKDAIWEPDATISVAFLEGDLELHKRIRSVAEQWIEATSARLRLLWRPVGADATIRISFGFAGSWSRLGKQAELVEDQSLPTMNFGWLTPDSTDLAVQEVVLHEFGHALGLIHEHSSPEANIPWDRKAVIRELSLPPNSWSVAQIEHNVLRGYDRADVRATPFDPDSIMLYPIKSEWTDGKLVTKNNTKLSARDIELIRSTYA